MRRPLRLGVGKDANMYEKRRSAEPFDAERDGGYQKEQDGQRTSARAPMAVRPRNAVLAEKESAPFAFVEGAGELTEEEAEPDWEGGAVADGAAADWARAALAENWAASAERVTWTARQSCSAPSMAAVRSAPSQASWMHWKVLWTKTELLQRQVSSPLWQPPRLGSARQFAAQFGNWRRWIVLAKAEAAKRERTAAEKRIVGGAKAKDSG